MDGYKEFIARIGDFFLVIGIFLFVLFVSSDLAKHAEFDYLFLSILTLGIAWVHAPPQTPATSRRAVRLV